MCCYFCYYRKPLLLGSKLSLPQNFNLYPASIRTKEGIKWVYIDSTGKVAIPTKFDGAEEFQSNGTAVVRLGEYLGVIDNTGKFIIKPNYTEIRKFKQGRAIAVRLVGYGVAAILSPLYEVLDENGKVLFSSGFISDFKNGRAAFSSTYPQGNGKYGYIDLQGKIVIPPQYELAGNFEDNKAVVKLQDNRYALIDSNGNILNIYPYSFVGNLQDGRLAFQEKVNGNYGFIDESGKVVIPPKFALVNSGFHEGRAVVAIRDMIKLKYGLIDKKGTFIIPPVYDSILYLDFYRLALGKNIAIGKPIRYAVADMNGRILTDFIYYGVFKYIGGYASVFDGRFSYLVDFNGKQSTNFPMIEGIAKLTNIPEIKVSKDGYISTPYHNAVVKSEADNRVSYYSYNGKLLWTQNTEVPLNNIYTLQEKKYKPNIYSAVYYPQVKGIKDENKETTINTQLENIYKFIKMNNNKEKNYRGIIDFNIVFFEKDLLVLKIYNEQNALLPAISEPILFYLNLGLDTGLFYELKDLFKKGSNYVMRINDIIENQIKKPMEKIYFLIQGYNGISPNQPFYITKNELNIYFKPNELKGIKGYVTFHIPFTEIMDIIDTNGALWKSFNYSRKLPTSPHQRRMDIYPASIRTKEGIRWGYINSSGKLVIPTKFAEALDFQPNGLAIVRENESKLAGLIDKTGDFIVKPIYDFIEYLGEGRFAASVNDEYTVFDGKGKEIFKNDGQVFGFKNGRAAFYSKMPNDTGKYGYIDLQGKVVIPPEFETTGMFNNGKAVVKVRDKRYAIIDLNGKILNTFPYEFVGDLQEGLMPFQEKNNSKFGFIDESGKVIIKPQYALILSGFEEERAVAGIGDIHQSNYGLIDKKGNYIIPPKFDEIRSLGEGRVAVGIHLNISDNPNRPSKYAIADIDGRFLTDFIYYGVDKFENGLASVFDAKYTYFIDKSGKQVTELPSVEGAGSISILDDIVKAEVDDRTSYYKKSGELLWRQNTEFKLNDIYTIVEKKNKANLYSTAYYPQINGIENKDVEIKINKKLEKLEKLYKTIKIYIQHDNNIEYGVEEMKRAVSRDFEVQFFEKDLLVIKIYGRFSLLYSASVGSILYYSHINLKDGTFYELKDLFKKNANYIFELNGKIKKGIFFYVPEIHEIKKDPTFYVTKDRLRVYAGTYPTGSPIESHYYDYYFDTIMNIIDTEGSFWRSFH